MAKFLSIEIDNCNLKIMEAEKKGEALSILKCISADIKNSVKDGKIIDMSHIYKLINDTLKINKIKAKKVIFTINSSTIMIRKIKLPLLKKRADILSMLQIELQQEVSADLTRYKLAYEISGITSENSISYADYIVYCIPVNLVSQYVELAEKLKLKLIKIDILPLCINTLYKNNMRVNNNALNIEESTAFINLQDSIISFMVTNNGFCDFYYRAEMETTYIEAAAEPLGTYMYPDIYQNSDMTIVSFIIKFMRYYYSVSSNKIINKIYLYGTSDLDAVEEIKRTLNIDAEIISSISNIAIDERISGYFEINKYLNNIMALFSAKGTEFSAVKKKKLRNSYGYAVISLIIGVAGFMVFGFVNSQFNMRNNISAMAAYIDDGNNIEVNNNIVSIKNETEYLDQYLKEAEKLQELIKTNDYVDSRILRKINKEKPSGTKVTSIHWDKDTILLQCVSQSMNQVTLFFSNLKKIEEIDNVYMPAIQSKTDLYSYSLVLKLKEVVENDS